MVRRTSILGSVTWNLMKWPFSSLHKWKIDGRCNNRRNFATLINHVIDACNKRLVSAVKGEALRDFCEVSYLVHVHCKFHCKAAPKTLCHVCHYSTARNKLIISASKVGTLHDSHGTEYFVNHRSCLYPVHLLRLFGFSVSCVRTEIVEKEIGDWVRTSMRRKHMEL